MWLKGLKGGFRTTECVKHLLWTEEIQEDSGMWKEREEADSLGVLYFPFLNIAS